MALALSASLAACGGTQDAEPPTEVSGAAPGASQTTVTPAAETSVELAPELVGLGEWVNSEPLTLAQLRGEPVLLVFWATW